MAEAESLAVGCDNEEMGGVDAEGNLIREEEPAGGEEHDWQENEDGKRKNQKKSMYQECDFGCTVTNCIDNYEEARANARNCKLFDDTMDQN